MSDVQKEVKPYKEDKDRWENLTVGMLKEMLASVPNDYEITYDGGFGEIHKGDFTLNHEDKEVIING